MEFNKLFQPLPYKDHAYDEIKRAIISHIIPEESILSERNLSEKLGISRTPLREAINKLELEGWLTSIPRKGIVISKITANDIKEVMQIRKTNDVLVLELVISRITDDQIDFIRQQFLPIEQLSDSELIPYVSGDNVHIQLAELCGNKRLLELLKNLSEQMQWFGYWALKVKGRAREVIEEHSMILDAIHERNTKKARQLILEHLDRTEAALLNGLQLRDIKNDC